MKTHKRLQMVSHMVALGLICSLAAPVQADTAIAPDPLPVVTSAPRKTVGQVARSCVKYATLPAFLISGYAVGHVVGIVDMFVAPYAGTLQGGRVWAYVWADQQSKAAVSQ